MTQRTVETTVGKLVTDEGFRKRFLKDPLKVSVLAGLNLSQQELEALSRIPQGALAALSEQMDDRICRLHVAGEPDGEERYP